MSTHVDYEYEIVLKVVHHELSNPDMPSLHPNALGQGIAVKAEQLMADVTVTVKSARLLGEVKP